MNYELLQPLTNFVVCFSCLQCLDDLLKRKHPPAMHWTILEKEFMDMQHCMVIWPQSDVREYVLYAFKVSLHIVDILRRMVFRCDMRCPPSNCHSQEHGAMGEFLPSGVLYIFITF